MDPFSAYLIPLGCGLPVNYVDIRNRQRCVEERHNGVAWVRCEALDLPVYDAALAGDVEALCEALRAGGASFASNAAYDFELSVHIESTGFALGVAAENNDVAIGRILLNAGEDLKNLIDLYEGNALNYAAYGGAVAFGKHLIALGYSADVATGDLGKHPAHALATRPGGWSQGDPRGFAELLTQHGATGNETNFRGEKCLSCANPPRGAANTALLSRFCGRASASTRRPPPFP